MLSYGLVLMALGAIVFGFRNVVRKQSVTATDEYVTAWATRLLSTLVILPVLIATTGIPEIEFQTFAGLLAVNSVIIVIGTVSLAKAYSKGDVSFIAPLRAFSPVPILVTGPLILGEWPSPVGLLGVLCIVTGTYFLKFEDGDVVKEQARTALRDRSLTTLRDSLWTALLPLRRVATNRGAQLMLLVACVYSISSNFDKIAIEASSPLFWIVILNGVSTVLLTPIMLRKSNDWMHSLQTEWRPLALMGVLSGIGLALQMVAIQHILVVYMSAIKQLSIPVSVAVGYLVFDESNIKARTFGTVAVTIGGVLIALG